MTVCPAPGDRPDLVARNFALRGLSAAVAPANPDGTLPFDRGTFDLAYLNALHTPPADPAAPAFVASFDVEEHHRIEAAADLEVCPATRREYGRRMDRCTRQLLDDLAARFAAKGIGEGTRAVLYSRGSMQWATRVWWTLRAVGFDAAAVLDGGFDKWSAEGRPTETAETRHPAAALVARPDQPLVAVLWGRDAQTVKPLLGEDVPTVESAHPSPMSADRGFFGSRPFSRVDEYLTELGDEPVDWRLP